jgi:hypothetical protein
VSAGHGTADEELLLHEHETEVRDDKEEESQAEEESQGSPIALKVFRFGTDGPWQIVH